MKKINEIFYSIQGEGHNAGRPAIFIRFSGCNIKCPFCDTKHNEGKQMTDDEIIAEVKKYPSELVILTGGEPTLFVENDFIEKLHEIEKIVAIETNGTKDIDLDVDFITVSPKFEYVKNAVLKLKDCTELKVVFTGENEMQKYNDINARYFYLQPCDTGDKQKNEEITQKAVEYALKNPKWSISLQTQKILNVR